MKYRQLGRYGIQVREISLGAWLTFSAQIAKETAKECMITAYENWINFFDNVEAYAGGMAIDAANWVDPLSPEVMEQIEQVLNPARPFSVNE
ncbi:hypothetical protein [Pajaroellobacter abortibovis]|nr:hypothetical protein [Pajaroellobacter abortibovis]